jgi:predicted ATPase
MLKRLRIDNFKSLINVVFEPGAVNLLIGKNNSGKTTLCQALRFLSSTSFAPLAEAVVFSTGEAANLTNAYLQKDTVTFDCFCEIRTQEEIVSYKYLLEFKCVPALHLNPYAKEYFVESETLHASGGPFASETLLMQNDRGSVRLLNEGRYRNRKSKNHSSELYVETTAPTTATMLSRLYDIQHNRYANVFKNYLMNWSYYDLETVRLRSGEANVQGFVLNTDGSNLANVIYLLKTIDERRYRRFLEVVREVEPKLDGINFSPPNQGTIFMALTDARDKRFGMASISAGTLRFMAIAYILLLLGPFAQVQGNPTPLVMIEEPENGLYVGHLKRLMSMLEPLSEFDPQVIFTSHSPYFVDQFDKYLPNVFVTKSDDTHSDVTRPDAARLSRILEDFPLGEAYFRGLLE